MTLKHKIKMLLDELIKERDKAKEEHLEHCLDYPSAPASPLWERNYGKEQALNIVIKRLDEILKEVKTGD